MAYVNPNKEIALKLINLSIILFVLIATPLFAGEILIDFDFSDDQVSIRKEGVYEIVELDNGMLPDTTQGTPWLPARFVNILLPAGAEFVGIDATGDNHLLAQEITVFPAQPPQSPSLPRKPFVPPLPSVYDSQDMTRLLWPFHAVFTRCVDRPLSVSD